MSVPMGMKCWCGEDAVGVNQDFMGNRRGQIGVVRGSYACVEHLRAATFTDCEKPTYVYSLDGTRQGCN